MADEEAHATGEEVPQLEVQPDEQQPEEETHPDMLETELAAAHQAESTEPPPAAQEEAAAEPEEAVVAEPKALAAEPEALPLPPATAQGNGDEDSVELKIVIQPEGFSHTKLFPASAVVGDVKLGIETDLRIPIIAMTLFSGEAVLDDDKRSLSSLGIHAPGPVELQLHISFIDASNERPAGYMMPDVITVEVTYSDGLPPKLIQVPIERADGTKPFLGGYRSKKTRIEFHHAWAQTDRTPPTAEQIEAASNRFHRETQTAIITTRSQQAVREASTQMETSYLRLDNSRDVVMHPLPYFDSDALAALRLEKTIDIQRYTRCFFARRAAKQLREAAARSETLAREQAEQKAQELETHHAREIERRMHPRTADDFDILYRELEAWRLQETARIHQGPESMRQPELNTLLLKEQKLLQTIDRLKLQADGETRDRRIRSVLEQMSAPKEWQLSDGDVAQVHTPFTTRAKELMELYNGLRLSHFGIDERLDVLLHVKWTVKEFDCPLTRDITELIDREADMLNRGRGESTLSGLRKRLANLFLQFIENPSFNPEAARFQKAPHELVARPNLRPMGGTHSVKAV